MKNIATFVAALLLGTQVPAGVRASGFDGAYVGLHLGSNRSGATSQPDKNNAYLGFKAGYNWDWDSFLLGAEGFADLHSNSYTNHDAGVDARLGLPLDGRWLPYAKLGLVGTSPGGRLHGGLGVEYGLSDRWSANAEWTTDSPDSAGITRKNNNIAIGLNLRLGDVRPAKASLAAAIAQVAAADNMAAERAFAERAAAERAVAERAAAERAAARSAYETIFSYKPRFASGSARLDSSACELLDKVVEFALQNQDADLTITGHADPRGNVQRNMRLSVARAEAVKAYLVRHDVAAERIMTKGEGSANPVAENKHAEGRAKNRRVEISPVIRESRVVLRE